MNYEINIGEKKYNLDINSDSIKIDGESIEYSILNKGNNKVAIYYNNETFEVEIVAENKKHYIYKVNGKEISLEYKDHLDKMLESLGIDKTESEAFNELNAPMPGTILSIPVKEGQTLQKGDTILILEAMKMENIIKSPAEVEISKIHVKEGENVEKNQLLVTF